MSDDISNGDSGSKDRATVALVGAKVDEVKAIVAGLATTTAANFETVHTRLDSVAAALVERAEAERRLSDKIEAIETRTTAKIETQEQKHTALSAIVSSMQQTLNGMQQRTAYRFNILPGHVFGALAIVAALIIAFVGGR